MLEREKTASSNAVEGVLPVPCTDGEDGPAWAAAAAAVAARDPGDTLKEFSSPSHDAPGPRISSVPATAKPSPSRIKMNCCCCCCSGEFCGACARDTDAETGTGRGTGTGTGAAEAGSAAVDDAKQAVELLLAVETLLRCCSRWRISFKRLYVCV